MSDHQASLLSWVGQEAVAHAALVFAALTAGFTFATGFQGRIPSVSSPAWKPYSLLLAIVFSLAAYAFGRMAFYGHLGHTILLSPQASTHLTLTDYWHFVNEVSAKSSGSTFIGIFAGFNKRAALVSVVAGMVATGAIMALFQ